jgi:hypothetical protein
VAGAQRRGSPGRHSAGGPAVSGPQPFYPAYVEDTLSRVLITMIALPVTVFAAAALLLVLLERLVNRPAFVSGLDVGRAAGTRAD